MGIRVTSTYDPFTLEELWGPLMQATQSQMKMEEDLSNFAAEGYAWKQYVNPERDPQAYHALNTYQAQVDQARDQLAKGNISPSFYKKMLDLKRSYATNIAPISKAVESMSLQAKEQRNKGAGYIFDIDMSVASLDDFLEKPHLSYRSAHLKDIRDDVSGHAAPFAQQILSKPNLIATDSGQYLYSLVTRGATPEDITMLIEKDPNAPAELKRLVETRDEILNAYVGDWANKADVSKAYLAANAALHDAIGRVTAQVLINRDGAGGGTSDDVLGSQLPYSFVTYDIDNLIGNEGMLEDYKVFQKVTNSNKFKQGAKRASKMLSYASDIHGGGALWATRAYTSTKEGNEPLKEKLEELFGTDVSPEDIPEFEKQLKPIMEKYGVNSYLELHDLFESAKQTTTPSETLVMNFESGALNHVKQYLIQRSGAFEESKKSTIPIFNIDSYGREDSKIDNPSEFLQNMVSIYIRPDTGRIYGLSTINGKEVRGIISPQLFPKTNKELGTPSIEDLQGVIRDNPGEENKNIVKAAMRSIGNQIAASSASLVGTTEADKKRLWSLPG